MININDEPIGEGEVFINVMEDDLLILLEKVIQSGLVIGEKVGIISYNEIPVKKFILNGIITISTDFHQMSIAAPETILSNSKEKLETPFRLLTGFFIK